jgi:SAM-dependent methyltransferase
MKDVAQVIDTHKIRLYNDWLFRTTLYEEGESGFHQQLTSDVVRNYIDPLNLPKDAHILDLGSGPGYFCDEMKARGYTNYTAVTLSDGDIQTCKDKGHRTAQYDISFLPENDGYLDGSVDMIFARHSLEHSPYPIFSLIEWNRLLKQGS